VSVLTQMQADLHPETKVFCQTISSLSQHMLASMDINRKDRLWPADPIVFQTNPLNLAYGACGTALFLYDALGRLPVSVRDWLLEQPVDNNSYPPGLYSGTAGVAWAFAEMDMPERALELFELVPESPLAFKAVDIFNGAAGWGLAALALYVKTREDWLLTAAGRAGDFLLQTSQRDLNGVFWNDPDNSLVRLGFAYGGSGVALFLLYLWWETKQDRYLDVARAAMNFEVAHGQVREGALVWGATTNVQEHRPYWLRGGAGVATALIRFAKFLKNDSYLDLAHRSAEGCAAFFSVAPHSFEGLAAMGESLLDLFLVTGERRYLEAAVQKGNQILLYRIHRPQGTAFPGRHLLRISHDYGTGGAGIGLYLGRLVSLGPRRFHDIFQVDQPQ
jgi:lanthionine synthetase-like protein